MFILFFLLTSVLSGNISTYQFCVINSDCNYGYYCNYNSCRQLVCQPGHVLSASGHECVTKRDEVPLVITHQISDEQIYTAAGIFLALLVLILLLRKINVALRRRAIIEAFKKGKI